MMKAIICNTGTVRLLVDAKNVGLISNLKNIIRDIRDSGYWIHDKIIKAALKEAGES